MLRLIAVASSNLFEYMRSKDTKEFWKICRKRFCRSKLNLQVSHFLRLTSNLNASCLLNCVKQQAMMA